MLLNPIFILSAVNAGAPWEKALGIAGSISYPLHAIHRPIIDLTDPFLGSVLAVTFASGITFLPFLKRYSLKISENFTITVQQVSMNDLLLSIAKSACFIVLIWALERAFPRETSMSSARLLRMAVFSFFLLAVAMTLARVLPLYLFRFTPIFSGLAGIIAGLIVGDFFYYWMHRAQHRFPILWRWHAVHHAVEKMGPGAGHHHVSESILKGIIYGAPVSLMVGGKEAAVMALLAALHGNYVHSTTKIHFGRFNGIIADNRVHRIHHSRERKHFDKNFGVIFPIWDRLFGTFHKPAADEWPDVGMDDKPEIRTIAGLILSADPANGEQSESCAEVSRRIRFRG